MLGKRARKLDAGVDLSQVPLRLRIAAQAFTFLLVGDNRRISCGPGAGVPGIFIRRLLILGSRLRKLRTLVERFGQQVVGCCGIGVVRKRLQVVAIPARCQLVVGYLLGFLRDRVVVRRDVLHVRLEFGHDLRVGAPLTAFPEVA